MARQGGAPLYVGHLVGHGVHHCIGPSGLRPNNICVDLASPAGLLLLRLLRLLRLLLLLRVLLLRLLLLRGLQALLDLPAVRLSFLVGTHVVTANAKNVCCFNN